MARQPKRATEPKDNQPAADGSAPDKSAAAEAPPEQKLGDTPVAPWEMPTPAEKAQAEPVRQALQEALEEIDSPEKAEAVVDQLAAAAAGKTAGEVADAEPTPETTAEAAAAVEKAAQNAPAGEKAADVLAQTAATVMAANGKQREAVAEATQEVLNAQQQGASTSPAQAEENYLRAALLKRLKPIDAFDARLFLRINHLPHTTALNRFFYFFTFVFRGGTAWFVLMALMPLFQRKQGKQLIREAAVPLALATMTVEYPVKWYFQRRRPFIDVIQAIVVGKKPGTWSFPSGHAATAFGGAWLFSRCFPRLSALWYTIAGFTAFSRIYLGSHYPGDVVSGSLLGVLLSYFLRRLPWPWLGKDKRR